MRQEIETTIAFYDEKYAKSTAHLDMQQFYDRFEKYLPEGASVLDAGCGSGRDSKHFIERGYTKNCIEKNGWSFEKRWHYICLLETWQR